MLFRSLALVTALLLPAAATAQWLPDRPVQTRDGRLTFGAEIVATAGTSDDGAFFNYTDYEYSAMRLLRVGLSGAWRPSPRLAFVGELRSEGFDRGHVFAAYMRVRPWAERDLDVQAGRIPPVFGAFARRAYAHGNPLIGYPLAYQYLTSLRADAVPLSVDDLLRMRGRGWRVTYPAGSPDPGPGVPLVSALRWDTGVQARWAAGPVDTSVAVTTGTLSNPRVRDDNGGRQLSARLSLSMAPGLVVGVSGARGAWLNADVPRPPEGHFAQAAAGLDIEYSRDRWILRAETVISRWGLPLAGAATGRHDVRAGAGWLEGRYRVTPRVYLAGRADRLTFSRIAGETIGSRGVPWDAPVDRLEVAAGYYVQRNVVARLGVQANWRDDGRSSRRAYVAGQFGWWF